MKQHPQIKTSKAQCYKFQHEEISGFIALFEKNKETLSEYYLSQMLRAPSWSITQ